MARDADGKVVGYTAGGPHDTFKYTVHSDYISNAQTLWHADFSEMLCAVLVRRKETMRLRRGSVQAAAGAAQDRRKEERKASYLHTTLTNISAVVATSTSASDAVLFRTRLMKPAKFRPPIIKLYDRCTWPCALCFLGSGLV